MEFVAPGGYIQNESFFFKFVFTHPWGVSGVNQSAQEERVSLGERARARARARESEREREVY